MPFVRLVEILSPKKRRWRSLQAVALLLAVTGCGRACGRKNAGPSDAEAPRDAAADAPPDPTSGVRSELTPLALASSGSRLHVLADGALLYTHGVSIDLLYDDGGRFQLASLRAPLTAALDTAPIGTVGGTFGEWLYASVVEDHYPASTNSKSFRFRKGHEAERILSDDVFYLGIARWNDGRLLGLRATGAVRWEFNSAPWLLDGFVVLAGVPLAAPKIPERTFVEGFVAFESGTVLAAATAIGAGLIDRSGVQVLRWGKDGGSPRIDRPPTSEGDRVDQIAARSEDDVWLAGRSSEIDLRPAWLQHWNGREWKREEAPFDGWVKSLSIGRDGTLWAVSDGMIGRAPNELFRRSPGAGGGDGGAGDGGAGAWTRIELPELQSITFAKPAPRVAYVRGALKVDRRRGPVAHAGSPTDPARPALSAVQVVARGPGVAFVVAQVDLDGVSTVLLRAGPAEPRAIVDLDDEEASNLDDRSVPPDATCVSYFVSAGEPTDQARRRVAASSDLASAPVVVARLDGKRVLGSAPESREAADELANTWRKLALPVQIRCARPPILELVVDPLPNDDRGDGGDE